MTRVSLVRTPDRSKGVVQAIDLQGINPVQGKKVALKPNFNSSHPAPGSTHIDTLRSLVLKLKDMGATSITVAERSGPFDTTHNIIEQKGVFRLAEQLGFKVVNLEEAGPEAWVQIKPKDSHWKNGFHFPRVYLESDAVVQTCCLKTHQFGGVFTLSLKCSVGMVPRIGYTYMDELHGSSHQRHMIAEINTAYTPGLIVLDGVDAFIDGGPATGTSVQANVMLAGSDRVAIDAVGIAILRVLGANQAVCKGKIFEHDQIARAVELGLGVKSAEQVQIITGDADSESFANQVRAVLQKG